MSQEMGSVIIRGVGSEAGIIDIVIEDGIIVNTGPRAAGAARTFEGLGPASAEIDGSGLLAIPGAIDPHVHMRDLGQAAKETWATGSRAARAGGITMVFDMPNSIPPTIDPESLATKRNAANGAVVRCRFYVGAAPGQIDSVAAILDAHPDDVVGIKLYMAGSSSNQVVSEDGELREYLSLAAGHRKVVAVHAEDQDLIAAATSETAAAAASTAIGHLTPSHHNVCRPPSAAVRATERALLAAGETGATLYLCHVSSAGELDLIRDAKRSLPVYCEVTPHHAKLDESAVGKWGNIAKVNPPLRSSDDRKRVVQALADGTADTIGSDHAPHLLQEKTRPYSDAPSGFPGLETSLGVVMTLYNDGVFGLDRLVDLTSRNVATIFGLTGYGSLAVGSPGDVTVLDPQIRWNVDPGRFESMARFSPFTGMSLRGRAAYTIVAGNAWNGREKEQG